MRYTSLDKVFYKGPEKYQESYFNRFNSESACHLTFKIGDSPAFFLVTHDVLSYIISIYKSDKELTLLRTSLPGVAIEQFTVNSLIDEVFLTNNIEGVYSTRQEIEETLESIKEANAKKRFHGLVQKYYMLQAENSIPLSSPQDIRTIYDELVLDEVEEEDSKNRPDGILFRKNIVIITSKTQKEIHRGVYPESKIIELLNQALSFLNSEQYSILIRLSIFHYLFGYIHPFYDGNGRTSRFISSYLLSKELDPLAGYRLSYTIKENIDEYYKAFRTCNNPKSKGDLTPFLLMFLKTIDRSMSQLIKALKKRHDRWGYYVKQCDRILTPSSKMSALYDPLIQASLFGTKGITADELCHVLRISRNTLSNRLSEVDPPNLLKVQTEKSKKYYSLDLEVLDSMIVNE